MDRAASTSQGSAERNPSPECGARSDPHPSAAPQGGAPLIAGQALAQTIGHFFPKLNAWLDRLPDSRVQQLVVYERRFLAWWGICLYLFQLGSRRQLDFELAAVSTQVLDNLNRLAGTQQTTRPVHDTLDHFLEHCPAEALAQLRTQMVQRLIRMKVLDPARLLGHAVLLVDGTGLLCWSRRHCDQCLVQRREHTTLYMHQVLEAKLLGPAGVVLSIGSEFIENADLPDRDRSNLENERVKQDCELKAFSRLAPPLKETFPQLQIVLAGDSLFACGRVFQVAAAYGWSYVVTFKEGHLPALWAEFQQLLPLCPENRLEHTTAEGALQRYRWVCDLSYQDNDRRWHRFNAIECVETVGDQVTRFAWLTPLPVNAQTVVDIALKGGRARWKMENEGFNRQKNSGLNLEHVYSINPEKWKAYYYLLQIAFIIIQLVERGSLLRRLAEQCGRTVQQLFGSLKNIARRMLDGLRYFSWPALWCDIDEAAHLHIGLDSS
jgi:hypothetical protein